MLHLKSNPLDLALLTMRALLGVVFVAHGAQKLFGAFGGEGLKAQADMMVELGVEPGMLFAVLVAASELGGGLLLLVGLLTPLGAAAITGVMVGAIATVNGANGFFIQDSGYEYNLLLIAIAVVLLAFGPGRYSIDHRLGLSRPLVRGPAGSSPDMG